jgi:CheY-like chemotaxis protein
MPGMDGIELTGQIKSKPGEKHSPVVMITSGDWKRIKDDAISAGVDKHMLKPLLSSMIIDCLNECLEPDNTEINYSADIDVFEGKKILLVEDIAINREIFIVLLEETGIIIDYAENGQEALDIIAAIPDNYDMIFMDVQMPKMDGLEATRRIRALPDVLTTKIPIVAMTARIFAEDIQECLAAGMNEHLNKPIDIDRVLDVLRRYLL